MSARAIRLLAAVVATVARMHHAGLSQRDIHPGNFLLVNEDVMVIDGADIRRHHRAPLPERLSINNLALFLAQFYPAFEAVLPDLAERYCRGRNWRSSPEFNARVKRVVTHWSDWREKKFLQKTTRPCTAFISKKTWHGRMACDRSWHSPALQQVLNDPDRAMAEGTVLKAGNSATVVKVTCGNQLMVVKRYNLKTRWHALRRSLRPTRAMISWRNANRLRFMGISTPRPLALIENRWGPLRGRAYFITTFLDGASIDRTVRENKSSYQALDAFADRLVQFMGGLHRLRLSHGDLKASNLILSDKQLFILDLDGMRKHHSTAGFQQAFCKDIQRLLKNWPNDALFYPLLKARMEKAFPDA